MDAPQRANSGHPGTALALAPLAYVLWHGVMRHDPSDPTWPDRDRFVLSAGHASILLYSLLYLCGYGLTLEDLTQFRQWGSRTPGHPEAGHTPGVEVTTGPLGQGFANGVGMAIAERMLRHRFGREVCDHYVFAICSDGDLEEGISHEAASLAGHLGLGRLVYVYDDNHITIDGPTELAYSDDVRRRFEAYGWHVDNLGEAANDTAAIETALRNAMAVEDRPSLIILRSHIGWPSPNRTDTAAAHGEPLGEEEVRRTKEILGLPPDQTFWVPDDVLAHWREVASRGRALREAWEARLAAWQGDRTTWELCLSGRGAPGWEAKLPTWSPGEQVATRVASGDCLNAILDVVPGLVAGGADLTANTGSAIRDPRAGRQSRENPTGRQIHYGVREHAMGAVMTGMAMHGGCLPVGGTFLIFSDYMRAAIRLAAMSRAHVVYSFSHDSVGLGEDGPTHQPIEHIMSLRAMPGLRTIRPADANECAQAWEIAVNADGPTALLLTRQKVPVLEGTATPGRVRKGAYVLLDADGTPDIVLVGTGSEVHVCVEAARLLTADGLRTRVVSMPSWELFADQDPAYRQSVFPPGVPTLAVEAGCSLGWERYADASVSIDTFGASAPGAEVLARFGFTAENVARRARELVTGGSQ
ncbi:MAG: transketolase [Acidimicrobiia bacterium]